MADRTMTSPDRAIEKLGIDLLRELRALAWFCDGSADGKYALIPSDRRHWYEPGGQMSPLAETGCVRLLSPSLCATVRQHRPSLRIEQFGRQVLVRARAMRLPIELDDVTAPEAPSQVAPQPQAGEALPKNTRRFKKLSTVDDDVASPQPANPAQNCRDLNIGDILAKANETINADLAVAEARLAANPAQVTDAMVEIGLSAAEEACMDHTFGKFREDSTFETAFTDEFKEQFRLMHRRALTAAIGAGRSSEPEFKTAPDNGTPANLAQVTDAWREYERTRIKGDNPQCHPHIYFQRGYEAAIAAIGAGGQACGEIHRTRL